MLQFLGLCSVTPALRPPRLTGYIFLAISFAILEKRSQYQAARRNRFFCSALRPMIKRTMKLKNDTSRTSLPQAASFGAEPSKVQLTKSNPATPPARKIEQIQPPKPQPVSSSQPKPGP